MPVLIELHQTSDVLVLVLGVDNLLHILLELENDRLFVFGLIFLISNFDSNCINLALHLAQAGSVRLQCATLIFKVFL